MEDCFRFVLAANSVRNPNPRPNVRFQEIRQFPIEIGRSVDEEESNGPSNQQQPVIGDQWYKLLDASKNVAGNLVSSTQKIQEYEKKEQKRRESEQGSKTGEDKAVVPKKDTKYTRHVAKIKKVVHYVEKPANHFLTTTGFVTLLIATALLLWQLVGKIQGYVANPIQVNTDYSYPSNMDFPGVMLCNSKPLRISVVGPTSMMKVINRYNFPNSSIPGYEEALTEANKLNVTEFYLNSVQQKEDFMLQCKWPDGTNCTLDSFEAIITDYGVCYRLKQDSVPTVSYSGSTNGLEVTLNIATYDNIRGPEKTIGAKLALYDVKETPLVTQIGIDSPPGFQTSVGVKLETNSRLPKSQKGNCDPDASLKLYKSYSYASCRMEQLFLKVIDQCKCKSYNMPDENGVKQSVPLCNAEQQLFCANPQMSSPIKVDPDTCPEACKSSEYTMLLSYSQISVERVVSNLNPTQKDKMVSGFYAAIGSRSAFEAETKYVFDEKVKTLINAYDIIQTDSMQPDPSNFQELKTRLLQNVPCYKKEFSWRQTANVTVSDILSTKQPVALRNGLNALQQIVSNLDTYFNYSYLLFPTLDQFQNWRDKVAQMDSDVSKNSSLQNDTNFVTQYQNAQKQMLQYLSQTQGHVADHVAKFQSIITTLESAVNNISSFATSDPLVTGSVKYTNGIIVAANGSTNCLIPFAPDLQNAQSATADSTFDVDALKSTLGNVEQKAAACSTKLVNVMNAIDAYYQNYSSILLTYELLLRQLETYKTDEYQFYSKVDSEQVVTFMDADYFELGKVAQKYLVSPSYDRSTMSQDVISNYKDYWLNLQDHFSRIRTQLLNGRISLDNYVQRIQMIKNVTDSKLLILASKDYLGSTNATQVIEQCVVNTRSFVIGLLDKVKNNSNTWRQSFDTLISDCTSYQASFIIDDKFYSENIVIFNIYYQDLAITKVAQSLTYNDLNLISDVAGTIGTILGFIGSTGLALYTAIKAMGSKAVKRIKERFKPESKKDEEAKDQPKIPEEVHNGPEGTVMIVVEEYPATPPHHASANANDNVSRVVSDDVSEMGEVTNRKEEIPKQQESEPEKLERNGKLPKIE